MFSSTLLLKATCKHTTHLILLESFYLFDYGANITAIDCCKKQLVDGQEFTYLPSSLLNFFIKKDVEKDTKTLYFSVLSSFFNPFDKCRSFCSRIYL